VAPTNEAHPQARPSGGAVFLSYASEDADAAQRVCAALRAGGIEVWFDRSELRGGDAWDATIRRQIKSCALFIPVISENSHARSEGYFRLEWKLAIDRSHLMSTERAFLLPVVVDGTRNDDDRIPQRFREVQWTSLPHGETPASFVEQVKRLLAQPSITRAGAEQRPVTAVGHSGISQPETPAVATTSSAAGTPTGKRRSTAALVLAAAVVLGAGVWMATRFASHRTTVVPYSLEDRRMTFAVLPFSAPADDPQAQKVAKATAESVTANIEATPLWAHVAPRRSVQQAANRLTDAAALSRDLNVHFLIRGTVASATDGNTVHLALLDGATERVLATSDLSVPAGATVPRWSGYIGDAAWHMMYAGLEAEAKAASAVPLDALDVRDLSFRAYVYWHEHRGALAKQGYMSASELLQRALALAPDDPLATYLTADINLCDCVLGWSPNVEQQKAIGAAALEKYLRIDPNDPEMLVSRAELFQLRGRFEESVVILDALLKREPENEDALATKAVSLLRLGRAKDAQPIIDNLMALYPDKWPELTAIAADVHYALGDYAGAAQLAANAAARMSETALKSPLDGPIRLTQVAAEARLGHHDQASAAFADFKATVPNVTTISQIRQWVYVTADLYGYEPLYEGLRLAGIKE
jgi:tetratricopeptide (TPR) repeat protein